MKKTNLKIALSLALAALSSHASAQTCHNRAGKYYPNAQACAYDLNGLIDCICDGSSPPPPPAPVEPPQNSSPPQFSGPPQDSVPPQDLTTVCPPPPWPGAKVECSQANLDGGDENSLPLLPGMPPQINFQE
jgi:hypothetical protein